MSTIAQRLQQAFDQPREAEDPIDLFDQDERDVQSLLRLALAAAASIGILALVTQLLA